MPLLHVDKSLEDTPTIEVEEEVAPGSGVGETGPPAALKQSREKYKIVVNKLWESFYSPKDLVLFFQQRSEP